MRLRLIASLAVLCLIAIPAFADDYTVQVGYADGLRGTGFFPSPWAGDAGIVFVGTTAAGPDEGAIMITNTSGASLTITDVTVMVGTKSFDLWGSNTIAAGQSLILTATANYNFDTSDFSSSTCGVSNGVTPTVTVTAGGTPTTFNDTGEVLNTSGYDFACKGNESFAWRPIGTVGGPAGVPEPGSFTLLAAAGALLLGVKYLTRFIA